MMRLFEPSQTVRLTRASVLKGDRLRPVHADWGMSVCFIIFVISVFFWVISHECEVTSTPPVEPQVRVVTIAREPGQLAIASSLQQQGGSSRSPQKLLSLIEQSSAFRAAPIKPPKRNQRHLPKEKQHSSPTCHGCAVLARGDCHKPAGGVDRENTSPPNGALCSARGNPEQCSRRRPLSQGGADSCRRSCCRGWPQSSRRPLPMAPARGCCPPCSAAPPPRRRGPQRAQRAATSRSSRWGRRGLHVNAARFKVNLK